MKDKLLRTLINGSGPFPTKKEMSGQKRGFFGCAALGFDPLEFKPEEGVLVAIVRQMFVLNEAILAIEKQLKSKPAQSKKAGVEIKAKLPVIKVPLNNEAVNKLLAKKPITKKVAKKK